MYNKSIINNHPNPPSGVIRYFNDIQCYWSVPVTIFMRSYIPHTYTDTPILYTGTCSNTELLHLYLQEKLVPLFNQ